LCTCYQPGYGQEERLLHTVINPGMGAGECYTVINTGTGAGEGVIHRYTHPGAGERVIHRYTPGSRRELYTGIYPGRHPGGY